MKICDTNCKHQKCECGHCKSYHLLQYTEANNVPPGCMELDHITLQICGCRGFKKARKVKK